MNIQIKGTMDSSCCMINRADLFIFYLFKCNTVCDQILMIYLYQLWVTENPVLNKGNKIAKKVFYKPENFSHRSFKNIL